MKNSNFSSLSEFIARVVSLVIVLIMFTVFFLARDGGLIMYDLPGYVSLISGSVIIYELLAFIFFEIFSFFEGRKPVEKADERTESVTDKNDLDKLKARIGESDNSSESQE